MNKIEWLCVLGLVIATLLPVSHQTADEAGLEADVSKNVHDLNSRIKRHSDGTYTSDVSKSMDQDLAMKFLQQAIEGNLSKKSK
ncbi:PREDICTED: exendin-3-like [Gekko japonicus]|uniref:Exendin-3-like n=1 Tax=Gekko japonicus TaxID=146911 RepID=A0ABM1JNZ2_GEKJA|nr:PREDICTED: exendin-3-like [Gekko japonicus]